MGLSRNGRQLNASSWTSPKQGLKTVKTTWTGELRSALHLCAVVNNEEGASLLLRRGVEFSEDIEASNGLVPRD